MSKLNDIALHGTSSQSYRVLLASVICHPTQVNTFRLNPSQTTRFTFPREAEGWVDLPHEVLKTNFRSGETSNHV